MPRFDGRPRYVLEGTTFQAAPPGSPAQQAIDEFNTQNNGVSAGTVAAAGAIGLISVGIFAAQVYGIYWLYKKIKKT